MDTITLKSLSFHAKHGYYERERSEGNHFEVDIIAKGDFKKALSNNDLSETFNYEQAEQIANEVFGGNSEKLIETLCNNVGEKIFSKNGNIKTLVVSVRKMNPPIKTPADYAEITMQWKR